MKQPHYGPQLMSFQPSSPALLPSDRHALACTRRHTRNSAELMGVRLSITVAPIFVRQQPVSLICSPRGSSVTADIKGAICKILEHNDEKDSAVCDLFGAVESSLVTRSKRVQVERASWSSGGGLPCSRH